MSLIEDALARGSRVILLNSVYQENPKESAEILARCDYVSVREVLSQRELAEHGIQARLHIDHSFWSAVDERAPFRDFSGQTVFTDFWSRDFGNFGKLNSVEARKFPYLDLREMSWSSVVKSLRTASLLVTGRHHAVYAACKAEIPFVALKGNSHKIEGLVMSSSAKIPIHSSMENVMTAVRDSAIVYDEFVKLFSWMKKQPRWRFSGKDRSN